MTSHLYLGTRKTSRDELFSRAARLATLFAERGLEPDDAVAVLLRNDTAYFEVIEACRLLGLYFVTLNWHAAPAEIRHILDDSRAKMLIGHADLVAPFVDDRPEFTALLSLPVPDSVTAAFNLAPPLARPEHDGQALLAAAKPYNKAPRRFRGLFAYTSGSTGRPKGIRRPIDDTRPDRYVTYAGLATQLMGLTKGDRFYTAAPLYHSAPNALSTMCIASDLAEVYIAPRFDAEQFLADVERFGITHCYIVPTMMARLLKLPDEVKARYDTSTLKFGISTGSAWPRDIKQAMIDWFGPIFYETYGASELGFITLISSQEALERPGSVGRVLTGGSIKIVDKSGQPCPVGEPGLIYVDLPQFGDFEYTNADGDVSGQRHGRHATVGDIGYLDADDYLYISDREKDMIISGGANIFPAEIEAALIQMPDILDCAVFGAPDDEFGEAVVAAVQCRPGTEVSLSQILSFLEDHIARFKMPRILEIHDQLPREDSGKIFKQRLRAPHWEAKGRQI